MSAFQPLLIIRSGTLDRSAKAKAEQAGYCVIESREPGSCLLLTGATSATATFGLPTDSPPASRPEFRLCYVDGSFAFFTTQSLEDQWGDDWGDAFYRTNAGMPYTPTPETSLHMGKPPWKIIKVAWTAALEPPAPHLSVEQINTAETTPWLHCPLTSYLEPETEIYAGTTLSDFIKTILAMGGTIDRVEEIKPSASMEEANKRLLSKQASID